MLGETEINLRYFNQPKIHEEHLISTHYKRLKLIARKTILAKQLTAPKLQVDWK